MIGTREEMRGLLHQLGTCTWTLAAIGSALESGIFDALAEPRTVEQLAQGRALSPARIERILDVLATAGVVVRSNGAYALAAGAVPFLQEPFRAAIQGEIRSNLMQPLALLDTANGAEDGWRHVDPNLLDAQGAGSGAFAPVFKMQIVPQMGDLDARLARPDARFLDVGVGVAKLAISMCRIWPNLSVV